jgi:hypothetical protein
LSSVTAVKARYGLVRFAFARRDHIHVTVSRP